MEEYLCYDDVSLVPQYSNVDSRTIPDLTTWMTNKTETKLPLIPANMDRVIGSDLADVVIKNGGYPIFHRFMSEEEQAALIYKYKKDCYISCGVREMEQTGRLLKLGPRGVCIDIAHGHSNTMISFIRDIRSMYPDIEIISGNICTEMAFTELANAGSNAVKAGVGCGCFEKNTRILMANGTYKAISKIKVGEMVINRDGIPVEVLNVINKGVRNTVKLRTNGWYEDTIVTPDHRYWVGDLTSTKYSTIQSSGYSKLLDRKSKTIPKQSKYKWKHISEVDIKRTVTLMPNDIQWDLPENIYIDLKEFNVKGRVTRNSITTNGTGEVRIKRNTSSCYELGYIFGTYLGDGDGRLSINPKTNCESGSCHWSFGLHETEIANKLENCIRNCFGYENSTLKEKKGNILHVSVFNKVITRLLIQFGKKTNKHLPKKYYCTNLEYIKGIFDGLIDSDGHKEKYGRERFSNTSIYLIELFQWCCLNLGYTYSSLKRKKTFGGLKNAKCELEELAQPYMSSKNNTSRYTKDYIYSHIMEINENEPIETFDIEVDCDTHSFIANGAIVHNSVCCTRMVTGFGTPQFTTISRCAEIAKRLQIPLIADGGIRDSRDIVLSLAAGASTVMCGKMFAKTKESSAEKIYDEDNDKYYLRYRGQSSTEFQKDHYRKIRTAEGVGMDIWCDESAQQMIDRVCGGIKSGLTYAGAKNIKELQRKAKFVKVTSNFMRESRPNYEK